MYLWERGKNTFNYKNYCSEHSGDTTRCSTENYCENNPSDEICSAVRSVSWVGEVALMYPSDVYLVYANGVDAACYADPTKCFIDSMGTAESNCIPSNGWIYNSNQVPSLVYEIWLLSSRSNVSNLVFTASASNTAGVIYYNDDNPDGK